MPDPPAPLASVAQTVRIPGGPATALPEDGSVWVGAHRSTLVYRIDPATGAILAKVQTDAAGSFDHLSLVFPGTGGPWAMPFAIDTEMGSVVHIDAATNQVQSSPVAARLTQLKVDAIADSPAGVWATTASQAPVRLVKLDARTGAQLGQATVASLATAHILIIAFGALWFAGIGDTTVERLDLASGSLEGTAAFPGSGVVGLVASDQALYAVGDDATIGRIDPFTLCVTAWRHVGGQTGNGIVGIGDSVTMAATSKALYVGYDRGALAILDPVSLDVVRAYRLDIQDYQGVLAFAGGFVWYPTFGEDSVLQIQP